MLCLRLLLLYSSTLLAHRVFAYNALSNELISTRFCVKCLPLSNGKLIPALGLGTWELAKTEEKVIQAIKDAVDVGYRYIVTGEIYQEEVKKGTGKALEEIFKSGKVSRSDLFITTKVWSNHHTEELAVQAIRDQLKSLRVDYVDLVLIHWPVSVKSGDDPLPKDENGSIAGSDPTEANYELAYRGLEAAVRLNLTHSIGVSNFNQQQLKRLLSIATIKPVINQVESHPFLVNQELLDFCHENGVRFEAYSPFRKGDKALLENATLKRIARKHNRSVAQVLIRWQIQRGAVVIPKTNKIARMRENADVFNFELSEEDMDVIKGLDVNNRVVKMEPLAELKDYPF